MMKLTKPAKAFIAAIAVAGMVVLAYSLATASHAIGLDWIVFLGLVVFLDLFAVHYQLAMLGRVTISVTESLLFVAMLIYGPEIATLLAAAEGLTLSLTFREKSWVQTVFNIATLSVSIWLSAHCLKWLFQTPATLVPALLPWLFVALWATASVHFAVNTLLVSGVIGLSQRVSVLRVWWDTLSWNWISFIASSTLAAIAFILYKNYGSFTALAIFAIAPQLPVLYLMYRFHRERFEASHRPENAP